jgi:hypothetical protein
MLTALNAHARCCVGERLTFHELADESHWCKYGDDRSRKQDNIEVELIFAILIGDTLGFAHVAFAL